MQKGLFDDDYNWESHNVDGKTISKLVRNDNYKELLDDYEKLSYTQELVFNALKDNPKGLCDRAIQKYIKKEYGRFLPISSICGRRNELMNLNIVTADGKTTYPDYNNCVRTVTRWTLTIGGFSH